MYVVFEYLIKRKGKEKVGLLFHKMKIFQKKGAYQPMNINLYNGFRKAVNFKFFFPNYSDAVSTCDGKLVS